MFHIFRSSCHYMLKETFSIALELITRQFYFLTQPSMTGSPTALRATQKPKHPLLLPSFVLASSFNFFFSFYASSLYKWRRQWQATPVLLPEKSHGWRSLVGCSPWGRYQSDATERLHFHFSLSHNGEGNGNPLQCSCLENPRDGGAWWVAVYEVAQSRTRLMQLSSSSSIQNFICIYIWCIL